MPAFDRIARPLKTTAALAIIAAAIVWMSSSIYGLVERINESREIMPPAYAAGPVSAPPAPVPQESSARPPASPEPVAKAIPTPSAKQDEGVPPPPKPHDFRDDYHSRLCPGVVGKEIHISPTEETYPVNLTVGCFSPLIYIPKEWGTWAIQLDGEWIAYTVGTIGTWGPIDRDNFNALYYWSADPTSSSTNVRLQGEGSATIYHFKKK